MKVLFVVPEYGLAHRGGIATFYNHTIPALVDVDCQVDVCVADPAQRDFSVAPTGVKVIPTDPASIDRATLRLQHFALFPGLQAILGRAFAAWECCGRGRGYDVVEATDWGLLYVPWVIQEPGPPVVVQLHGSNGQVTFNDPFEGCENEDVVVRMLEMALLGRADELQAGGRANADAWSHLLRRPVHHIWPAWSPERAHSTAITAGLEQDTFGLVVGRIQSWKGPEVLCQALALLGEAAPKVVWVGRDHPFRRLDLSLSDHLRKNYPGVWSRSIISMGEAPVAKVTALQAAAKFVVVPSTWDTFNLTAVEAMGMGKVVICSEGAGAADLIKHGENGFRFPAENAMKLASLVALVDKMSAKDRVLIGQRAKETIKRELAPERVCVQRLEHYNSLGNTGRASRACHPWLDSFFTASEPVAPLAYLEKVPLKQLIHHVRRRAIQRLRAGVR